MRAVAWSRARALAGELATALPPEDVPIAEAAGRVLAEPLRALTALPGFDNAAMDGYAVRGDGPWRLAGRVLAGCPDPGALADRTAVEIATGAPVPTGTDRVVPYEVAALRAGVVTAPAAGREYIRRGGEDAAPGDVLLPAGHPVTPVVLGVAASAGADTLRVVGRPRVRVLLTGDEVVRAGLPGPGQVRDALGPLLPPLLAAFGAGASAVDAVGDRGAGALTAALAAAAEDVVIVCGSSSVGPADHLHAALAELRAEVHVDGVACRPGRPQLLARAGTAWIVGLPGNPYAALVAAYTLLQPLVAGLTGRRLPPLPTVAVSGAARPFPGGTRLVPVRWGAGGAVVVPRDRPGYLGAAARADALAVIEPGWTAGTPAGLILQR